VPGWKIGVGGEEERLTGLLGYGGGIFGRWWSRFQVCGGYS